MTILKMRSAYRVCGINQRKNDLSSICNLQENLPGYFLNCFLPRVAVVIVANWQNSLSRKNHVRFCVRSYRVRGAEPSNGSAQ